MRLLQTWIVAIIATCAAQQSQNDLALAIRQATTTSAVGSSPQSILSSTVSRVEDLTSSPTPSQTSQNVEQSQILRSSATTLPESTPITNSTSNALPSASSTISSAQNVLPIRPTITPAIGVAGVILIVGGLVLCFVGIKNRSIQIFFSTALLVALSIEVLIIYVMNPPVSDAVQGGYLVAGVVGGAIIGGIAMIFKEVTEGLGCVLGGFSFAMWLLVLAPGGTIKSDVGRIVLIAVFCVACFALSFSRHTRHYSIMACTSFAGATVFIIGVDCFSRAGLKEFWLYLWNLNSSEFPLGTNTYPSTRYIRVEVALNVIVAVLGVFSQIKLWKIIREKRSRNDAERLQDEEDREQFETEVGRDLEARNMRDRAHWEGTYGDKDVAHIHVDSALGSSIDEYSKGSSEVREREIDAIELSDISNYYKRASNRDSNHAFKMRPTIGETISQERLIGPGTTSGFFEDYNSGSIGGQRSLQAFSKQPSLTNLNRRPSNGSQMHTAHSKTNEVENGREVPNEAELSADETSRIHGRRGVDVEQLSLAPESGDELDDAMHSPFEDDRASSVAATAAEDPDLDALSDVSRGSRAPSPYTLSSARNSALQLEMETPLEEEDEEILQRPINPSVPASRRSSSSTTSLSEEPIAATEDAAACIVDDSPPVANLGDHLPRKLTKAASKYRTTEWAKEAGRAEPEPIEELTDGTVDGVRIDLTSAAEAARAEQNNASQKQESLTEVDEQPKQGQALQRESSSLTAIDAETLPPIESIPFKRDSSQSLSKNPYRQSATPSRQSLNTAPIPAYAHSANGSRISIQRAASNSSQFLNPRRSSNPLQTGQTKMMIDGSRNVSAPLVSQTLIESPSEDSVNPTSPPRHLSTASSDPNLLAVREHKLKERATSSSISVPLYAQNLVTQTELQVEMQPIAGGVDNGNDRFVDFIPVEGGEEMTLSERKHLVKEQVRRQSGSGAMLPRPPSMHRLSQPNMPNWPLSEQPPLPTQLPQQLVRMNSNSQQLIYDSHQPRRTSTYDQNKAGQNWSVWQSQKAVAANQRSAFMSTDDQMDMLRQQRAQHDLETRQRTEQQQAIQAQKDVHMRMGGMHDAHRSALSRMQSQANKNASAQGAL